jgi:hypothetical protein
MIIDTYAFTSVGGLTTSILSRDRSKRKKSSTWVYNANPKRTVLWMHADEAISGLSYLCNKRMVRKNITIAPKSQSRDSRGTKQDTNHHGTRSGTLPTFSQSRLHTLPQGLGGRNRAGSTVCASWLRLCFKTTGHGWNGARSLIGGCGAAATSLYFP